MGLVCFPVALYVLEEVCGPLQGTYDRGAVFILDVLRVVQQVAMSCVAVKAMSNFMSGVGEGISRHWIAVGKPKFYGGIKLSLSGC